MAQNLLGDIIWSTLQSELKKLGGQKKSGIPYLQAPIIIDFQAIYFLFGKSWFSAILLASLPKLAKFR